MMFVHMNIDGRNCVEWGEKKSYGRKPCLLSQLYIMIVGLLVLKSYKNGRNRLPQILTLQNLWEEKVSDAVCY